MLRWAQKHWVVVDLGPSHKNFPGTTDSVEYYKVRSDAAFPPTHGWVVADGIGPAPELYRRCLSHTSDVSQSWLLLHDCVACPCGQHVDVCLCQTRQHSFTMR